MSAYVNVNGVITDAADAVIPVYDHGFLYGEGVYEVLRTYDGAPFFFERHMTLAAAGIGSADTGGTIPAAYIRVLLTRGVGEITYDPAACPTPSLVIIAKPLPSTPSEHYERGVKVAIVDPIRNHPQSVSPLIKSNNLLNNALGMQQAIRAGAVEGVFRNYRGELSECAQSNLFIVSNGVVRTPPLEAGLLA